MSRIGLGHQNQIAYIPGTTTKALRLKNGRYTRKIAPGNLSGWGEVWIGIHFYVQNEFLWDGAIPSGGIGYGANLLFSFGLSNGLTGSLPARDVYGTQTYWIGRRSSASGTFNLLRPSPYTSGDYLTSGFIPRSVKNGTVTSATAVSLGFLLNSEQCWIQRFRTSGGNLYVSDILTCPITRSVSVYEMIDILNTSTTWATIATRANSRYGWVNTTEAAAGLSVTDEQATYGTLDSVDIGWWQNQSPFYLDTILTKIV